MRKASCFKEFVTYSSLNVLGMIGLSCYILADTFFIAKNLGSNGLTALNLVIPIYGFINGSGLMIGIGGGTKYTILKSQKRGNAANETFTNVILLTACFALFFFLLGVFFSGKITELLGADEEVFQMSKIYLQVILLFAPMFLLNNVLLCFIRNDGAPHLAMMAMLVGSFSNIVLDYIFIFPMQMGILGAVLATGFAPVISILILSPFFIKKKNSFHLKKTKLNKNLVLGIFSNGLPSLITELSSGIVILVFNIIILKLQGNIGVAAYGVIANLSLVVVALYTGIAQGIQPIICNNYGSGNLANIKAILRYALTTTLLISTIVYLSVLFGSTQIVQLFNSEQNMLLQSIATTGLKLYFTACPFVGFNIIISVYFTSTEYPGPAHIISILRGFLLIIPMAFLLSALAGIIGVWCVFPATELLVCVIGLILYKLSKSQKADRKQK